MLEPGFISVFESRDRDEFKSQVVTFAETLGFDRVSVTLVIDRPVGESEFLVVDNVPDGYREIFDDRSIWRRDPISQHCRHKSLPIVWDRSTYISAGQVRPVGSTSTLRVSTWDRRRAALGKRSAFHARRGA